MSEHSSQHKTGATAAAVSHSQSSTLSYPVRRMRNTAVLVKWIEEHQSNPYPTKAEKQYLAYYSGMNLTQLSTWFANARRRIKKIGMKTWLEGRSTFSIDCFSPLQRPAIANDSYSAAAAAAAAGGSYHGISSTSPYAYSPLAATASLHNTYSPHQHSSSLGMAAAGTSHLANGLSPYDTSLQSSTSSSLTGLYGVSSTSRSSVMALGMPTIPVPQWPTTPLLPSNPVSFSSLQSRPGSNAAPLHSPLTAQVYSADTTPTHLRSHSHSASQSIDVGDATYTLQQHSPEQMLPECASTEPAIIQENHKTATN